MTDKLDTTRCHGKIAKVVQEQEYISFLLGNRSGLRHKQTNAGAEFSTFGISRRAKRVDM